MHAVHYASSVQPLRTNRNESNGLVCLGAGCCVMIDSVGRSHGGTVTIEPLDPRSGAPRSLQEWRALAPAPDSVAGVPDGELRWCWRLTLEPIGAVCSTGPEAASSQQAGVRLGVSTRGRRATGHACLAAVPPSVDWDRLVLVLV